MKKSLCLCFKWQDPFTTFKFNKGLLLLAILTLFFQVSWSQDALDCDDDNTVKVRVKPGYNDPTGDGDADFRGWKHISDASSASDARSKFKDGVEEDIKNGSAGYLESTDGQAISCPGVCPNPNEVGCETVTVKYVSGTLRAVAGDNSGYNVKQKNDYFKVKITCGPCNPVTGGNVQAVFPNPVFDILTFQIEVNPQPVPISIEIRDANGTVVQEQQFGPYSTGIHEIHMDVHTLIPDMYFAFVYFENIPAPPENFVKN
ncbi:hypothetical protein POV27_11450 [Aureisphaera galaxeae]|uniref:hypothetical protein n=1 Tax=Aureisphaera galaxeae TaxID=1538023 RepID=UPI002350223F|nr:hypothetical protein [Aureisphaera galaxeae]MDC8004667.1 hypothetical protein [Aureisphaera galaxeae]